MNRIGDLITQMCPDGVEFMELQELFTIRNGYTPSTANQTYWLNGTISWFRMEDIRNKGGILSDASLKITKEAVKGSKLFPAYSIIVSTSATIGEHALITIPHLSNQRFTSLALKTRWSDRIDMKFIYYYCFILDEWCHHNTTTSSFASVDMNRFKEFRIPIPPLEVQCEIVKILDTFSMLEAELEARRQQYEYYRDTLLNFEGRDDARWLTLGTIGALVRGNGMPKSDLLEHGIGCIHYGQIYTHYGTWTSKTVSFISPQKGQKLTKVDPGDLIITNTSENLNDVCKAVAWMGDTQIVTGGHATVLKHDQDARYLSYYMQTPYFAKQKKKYATGTKVFDVSASKMANICVPVPSLAEQERIASILDKFDTLVNDISSGLPAEIKARRQQYEYYRDRLLTFQEKK